MPKFKDAKGNTKSLHDQWNPNIYADLKTKKIQKYECFRFIINTDNPGGKRIEIAKVKY